ncbi:hypothetical protein [Deinococcus aetherius]|nr:hypothetical protein [Deinococcus aetherius]
MARFREVVEAVRQAEQNRAAFEQRLTLFLSDVVGSMEREVAAEGGELRRRKPASVSGRFATGEYELQYPQGIKTQPRVFSLYVGEEGNQMTIGLDSNGGGVVTNALDGVDQVFQLLLDTSPRTVV